MSATATGSVTVFEAACRGEAASHTPVWIMRQAGRYLPEYRKVREKVDFLTLTRTPELAAEVTLQPIRRFDLDASILFSDIMTPVEGMGIDLEFNPGPVIAEPIRGAADVDRLRVADARETVPFVAETVRILERELPAHVPLIGFAGAPFTLMCYLVEGKGSKDFVRARAFLHAEPAVANRLLEKLALTMVSHLREQARAGARALMLFDSWAGVLSPAAYDAFALPAARRVLDELRDTGLPLVYFPNGVDLGRTAVGNAGADVIGVDWRRSLADAAGALGPDVTLQGNLDPAALFAPRPVLAREIDRVLGEAEAASGHIFNLGHGIDRASDPDQVAFLVDYVHERTQR